MDKLYNLYSARKLADYCDALKAFTQDHLIIICSQGTPCGAADFNEEVSSKICSLGCKTELYNKMHHSYVAVIDCGNLIFEQNSESEAVAFDGVCHSKNLKVISKNFNVTNWYGISKGIPDDSIIEYGSSKLICQRGLTFAVYAVESGELVHTIHIDTYCTTRRKTYVSTDKNWAARWIKVNFPQITVLTYCTPKWIEPENDECSDNEILSCHYARKEMRKSEAEISKGIRMSEEWNAYLGEYILKNVNKPWFAMRDYVSDVAELIEINTPPVSYIDGAGVKRFFDVSGKNVSILNGHRKTNGNPVNPKRKVYMIGNCKTFGIGSRDEDTISSKLQGLLNKNLPEDSVAVENYGIFTANTDVFIEYTAIFRSLSITGSDLLLIQIIGTGDINCFNALVRPHDFGEVYWDNNHLTAKGNAVIANKIFESLQDRELLTACESTENIVVSAELRLDINRRNYGFSEEEITRLGIYKEKLSAIYQNICKDFESTPEVGCVVMHCNPFTLGHLFLIEKSASLVDHLVIFIVFEDKSQFSFTDRFELVKKGVSHISNVSIVESGEFLASAKTFSSYFNKVSLQDIKIDTSFDAELFAREIAPVLHISKRFVGNEPLDNITRQYIETLAAILPKHGIALEVIQRRELNGKVVSASLVRKLLESRNFQEIAEIVPKSTYDYLYEMYK